MSRILKFNEYLRENEGLSSYAEFTMLPKKLQSFFRKNSSKNLLPKVLSDGRFFINLEGDDIYFKLNGKSVLFPFIKFVNDNIEIDSNTVGEYNDYIKFENELQIPEHVLNYSRKNIIDRVNGGGNRWVLFQPLEDLVGSYFSRIIYFLSGYFKGSQSEIGHKELNPFTDLDVYDNESMKTLEDMGSTITSTEKQKKNGTIVISNNNLSSDILIYSNGYIRGKNKVTDRISVLTNIPELSRPIISEEDLNIKLTYVVTYVLKSILRNSGVGPKEIKKATDSIISGNFKDYNDLVLDIAKNNPTIAHNLPDPNNIIPEDIKRGASILSRFRFFDS